MTVTSFSANDLYCILQKGFKPGNIIFGNALHSLEVIKNLESYRKTPIGEELRQLSLLIREAREVAYDRMLNTAIDKSASLIDVYFQLLLHPQHIEFLANSNMIHNTSLPFSTAATAQELYIYLDAGYSPTSFLFNSVTYAVQTQGLFSGFKNLTKGEVKPLSEKFRHLRNKTLEQIIAQAKNKNANAVVGINIIFNPVYDRACEMLMTGTASVHSALTQKSTLTQIVNTVSNQLMPTDITSSHLSASEVWTLAKMGFAPLRVLIETSVYSFGVSGQINTPWRILSRSENNVFSKMITDARLQILNELKEKANHLQADDVIGTKIFINPLDDGLIEILGIGTAIKKIPGINTKSEQLPLQAIISEKTLKYANINTDRSSSFTKSLIRIFLILFIICGLIALKFYK